MDDNPLKIPTDMIDADLSAKTGGTTVSIRDMMILLGVSDEELRDMDERDEILAREPWRKASIKFEALAELPNGMKLGVMRGAVDWSGTRFAKLPEEPK